MGGLEAPPCGFATPALTPAEGPPYVKPDMITGFNTDVDHQGRVFHIQTEDKGLANPLVESLIYSGGEILTSKKTSYADLIESNGYSEDEIMHRMEAQHQALIRDVFNGKFDTDEPKPFGHSIITNRSLDEVVICFLETYGAVEPIRLDWVEEPLIAEGTQMTVRIRLVEESSGEPIGGVPVVVELISTGGQPRELSSAATDAEGIVEALLEIPESPEDDMAVVCRAEVAGQTAEVRQMVVRAKVPARSKPKAAAKSGRNVSARRS